MRSEVNDGPEKVYHAGESFAAVPGDHHGVSANASETENAADVWSVVICCTPVIPRRVERGDAGG